MARRSLVPLAALLALAVLASAAGRAQETPKPDAGEATGTRDAPTPKKSRPTLRVQIAIARYQGERKLASVPYTVAGHDGRQEGSPAHGCRGSRSP